MKRGSYRFAIFWIAANDDTEWALEEPGSAMGSPSVTATLVADIFGVDTDRVRKDVLRELAKQREQRSAS